MNLEFSVKDTKQDSWFTQSALDWEFGESLLIFPDDTGKLLVIPDNLKTTTLAAEQMRIKG